MTRDELILAVALRMDEITPEAGLSLSVDGTDNNPLYALILGLIDESVLEIYTTAPYWRLTQEYIQGVNNIKIVHIVSNDNNSRKIICIKVPDNFLRIAEISHPQFLRPITELFPEQSDIGKRQHNRFLMGKEAKPIGIMSHAKWSESEVREIDCYSLAANDTSTISDVSASYIPAPSSSVGSPSTTIRVPDVLLPALEWLIASRAFSARGDTDHAAVCMQNAKSLLV